MHKEKIFQETASTLQFFGKVPFPLIAGQAENPFFSLLRHCRKNSGNTAGISVKSVR